MGGFFSSFKTKEAASVMLDFEKATPSSAEEAVFGRMQEVLQQSEAVLASIATYPGCQTLVQAAISTPTNENLSRCWEALKPAVGRLREYYEFTQQIEASFPDLLRALCEDGSLKLGGYQALARQLAGLLDFVIRFDHHKLNTPSIQNDFSYYRRSLQRNRANGVQEEGVLSDELAHKLSMFYAQPTPAMNVLVACVLSAVQKNVVSLDLALSSLATMASSTREMLRNRSFSQNTSLFCLRSMISSIIVFDQIDEVGAFSKKSPINVRSCVSVLAEWSDATERVALANMLRYTAKHLKDETTVSGLVEAINEVAESGGGGGGGNNNNN